MAFVGSFSRICLTFTVTVVTAMVRRSMEIAMVFLEVLQSTILSGMAWLVHDGLLIAGSSSFDRLILSPSYSGENPLPCYPSKEQGGRNYRIYITTFISRGPSPPASVKEHSDTIPWGIPYVPGSQVILKPGLAGGIYTLYGKASGEAKVNITWGTAPEIGTVSVVYKNYSLDGKSFLNGNESVTGFVERLTDFSFDWYSDIRQTGAIKGTKKKNPGGYHANTDVMIKDLTSNGTLTTTLDGVEWRSPQSGT